MRSFNYMQYSMILDAIYRRKYHHNSCRQYVSDLLRMPYKRIHMQRQVTDISVYCRFRCTAVNLATDMRDMQMSLSCCFRDKANQMAVHRIVGLVAMTVIVNLDIKQTEGQTSFPISIFPHINASNLVDAREP